MRHILSLSIGTSRDSETEITEVAGRSVRITKLGVDYDVALFESLLKEYNGECDAICIQGLPPPLFIQRNAIRHKLYESIDKIVTDTPVYYGNNLGPIIMTWSIRRSMEDGELDLKNANLLFLSGLEMPEISRALEAGALTSTYIDAFTHFRLPKAKASLAELEKYAVKGKRVLEKRRLKPQGRDSFLDRSLESWLKSAIRSADIIVTPPRYLDPYLLRLLKDKTVLIDSHDGRAIEKLKNAKVQNAYYPHYKLTGQEKVLDFAVMEAMIAFEQGLDYSLTSEDIVDYYSTVDFDAKLGQLDMSASEIPRKYAFVIHPLARRDLFRHPLLRPLMSLPLPIQKKFEQTIAKAPGAAYGYISGVRSEATGAHADGLIYTLFATPREMMEASPEDIYRKIVAIGQDASERGVKIMGLGAFTKIVGDAGVTIAARSKIPVTTGNSLSAAATLWAAKEACKKMGFIKPLPDSTIRVEGTVMIIGATGSIGKACTSVLGASFSHIIIAAINVPRLMTYKNELQAMYPGVKIQVTTQPERFADQCDLIVVSTSATEGGAFTLDRVKPGCVICDVSRPLTFSAKEAVKRPDVLIIESGEIELPGTDVKVSCDMGLENSVVYACLAETALLALEGRYESFTLSRNVNYKKVKEIYKLARKHGARLAQIRSPNGVITDFEVELCREHALKELAKQSEEAHV